jgi:membrane-bound lytic murein transglycosylase B
VDYDGNGRADLIHSPADVLASTANLLKGSGWKAGQPFGEGTENLRSCANGIAPWSIARPSSISPSGYRRGIKRQAVR